MWIHNYIHVYIWFIKYKLHLYCTVLQAKTQVTVSCAGHVMRYLWLQGRLDVVNRDHEHKLRGAARAPGHVDVEVVGLPHAFVRLQGLQRVAVHAEEDRVDHTEWYERPRQTAVKPSHLVGWKQCFTLTKKKCVYLRNVAVYKITGYNQSFTGCGSQRKQCSCYSTKTNVHSNLIGLHWEKYTLKVVFVEHHTQICVYVSQRSQIQFEDEDRAIYMRFCWVTTTWLRWEPQPVTLWLYPVKIYMQWYSFLKQW